MPAVERKPLPSPITTIFRRNCRLTPRRVIWLLAVSKEQAGQCLANIKAIVESINHSMADVVKVNVFVKNIADVAAVNEVYAVFPRRCSGASRCWRFGSAKDALIQIDAVVSNAEGTARQAPCGNSLLVRCRHRSVSR